jgi:hypothetical protein
MVLQARDWAVWRLRLDLEAREVLPPVEAEIPAGGTP